jgi:hypothetical protein
VIGAGASWCLPFPDHKAGVDQSLDDDLGRFLRIRDLHRKVVAFEPDDELMLWGELGRVHAPSCHQVIGCEKRPREELRFSSDNPFLETLQIVEALKDGKADIALFDGSAR